MDKISARCEPENPEIFYPCEWNFHYFRQFRDGEMRFVIVMRDAAGRIVAIAPFASSSRRASSSGSG